MTIIPKGIRWPSQPAEVAATLRRAMNLPELHVKTERRNISVRWTGGPTPATVRLAVIASGLLDPDDPWRLQVGLSRVYRPCDFGAALLLPRVACETGWKRGQAAWRRLDTNDLSVQPLPHDLVELGELLVRLAQVPSEARIGYARRRWDVKVFEMAQQVPEPVLRAILAEPSTPAG